MKNHPPGPRCKIHRCDMFYVYGQFPLRWFYCPECRLHWKECGISLGTVDLKPAFDQRC
jgi:hypothetical protein